MDNQKQNQILDLYRKLGIAEVNTVQYAFVDGDISSNNFNGTNVASKNKAVENEDSQSTLGHCVRNHKY